MCKAEAERTGMLSAQAAALLPRMDVVNSLDIVAVEIKEGDGLAFCGMNIETGMRMHRLYFGPTSAVRIELRTRTRLPIVLHV